MDLWVWHCVRHDKVFCAETSSGIRIIGEDVEESIEEKVEELIEEKHFLSLEEYNFGRPLASRLAARGMRLCGEREDHHHYHCREPVEGEAKRQEIASVWESVALPPSIAVEPRRKLVQKSTTTTTKVETTRTQLPTKPREPEKPFPDGASTISLYASSRCWKFSFSPCLFRFGRVVVSCNPFVRFSSCKHFTQLRRRLLRIRLRALRVGHLRRSIGQI